MFDTKFRCCPLKMMNRSLTSWYCEEEDCAWWCTYFPGDEAEYSECAIESISMRVDIAPYERG